MRRRLQLDVHAGAGLSFFRFFAPCQLSGIRLRMVGARTTGKTGLLTQDED